MKWKEYIIATFISSFVHMIVYVKDGIKVNFYTFTLLTLVAYVAIRIDDLFSIFNKN